MYVPRMSNPKTWKYELLMNGLIIYGGIYGLGVDYWICIN